MVLPAGSLAACGGGYGGQVERFTTTVYCCRFMGSDNIVTIEGNNVRIGAWSGSVDFGFLMR